MNKSLTLTIVIPVYNEERYLKGCLDSIARQSAKPDEVIVVDNNSTDATRDIASSYPFVKLLTEDRQAVYFARTAGFKAARSDIIARIDGDTFLPARWVERVLKEFQSSDIDALTGPVSYYDMPLPKNNLWFDHMMREYTYKLAPKAPFLYGSNMAIRRSSWHEVARFECAQKVTHEDIDLAIHMRAHGQTILYDRKFVAKASGRRINDSVKSFVHYVRMYRRTYRMHNIGTLAVYPAIFMWSLGYLLVHPWRSIWYPLREHFSNGYPVTRQSRVRPYGH